MAIELLSSSIPNLINGVSQQPPALRLPSQAETQVNGLSSVVNGLSKRPNTQFIKKLGNANELANCFIHTMQRDNDEFYILVISTSAIRVFDKDGVERSVTGSASYLSGLISPSSELAATTVNDFTYIVNKSTTTATTSALSPTRNPEALAYIKKGAYATTYTVKVTKNGITSTSYYTTMNSTQSSDALVQNAENTIKTSNITIQLQTFPSPPSNMNISRIGANILHFESTDGVDFDFSVEDSQGDTLLLGFKDTVADFKTLPPEGPTGYKIAVVGDNTKGQDDYYVELRQPESNGTQVWKETLKDNILFEINPTSMPHTLVSNADGTFTFAAASW